MENSRSSVPLTVILLVVIVFFPLLVAVLHP